MRIQGRTAWASCLLAGSVYLAVSTGCGESGSLSLSAASMQIQATEDQQSVQGDHLRLRGEVKTNAETIFLGTLFTQNGLEQVSQGLTNPFTIHVQPKPPTQLGAGTYTDELTVAACTDEACDHHFEGSPRTVPVTYTIAPAIYATSSSSNEALTYIIGSSTLPRFTIDVRSYSTRVIPWTATKSKDWLQLASNSGQTPSTLTVTINPEGLEPGQHFGGIVVTDTAMGAVSQPINRTLVVTLPAFQVSCEFSTDGCPQLTFGGEDGRRDTSQEARLSFFLGTGMQAYPWTAAIDTGGGPAWLNLSATSGAVSGTGVTVTASVNPAGLPGGTYTGRITFSTSVKGHTFTQSVPVTLNVDSRRLSLSDNGVALVSLPSSSHLTQTVRVRDNLGGTGTAWTASSNRDWLSVTPSGLSGGTLTVTANPAGLAPGMFHQAAVTLSSSNPSVVAGDVLQVGLWVADSDPANVITLPRAYSAVEFDPIRPLAYVHDRYSLFVYNIYTGALVTTLRDLTPRTGAAGLSSMVASSDGATLYVSDFGLSQMVPIDLSTLTAGTRWGFDDANGELNYVRPDGKGLILSNGHAYDPSTGARYPGTFALGLAEAQDNSLHCNSRACYTLAYSQAGGGKLLQSLRGNLDLGSDTNGGYDVALSPDGSRIYVATHTPFRFQSFSSQNLQPFQSLLADAIPTKVAVGVDNRLYGAIETRAGPTDVWFYDAAGERRGTLHVANEGLFRDLEVSSDGKRIAARSDTSLIIASPP